MARRHTAADHQRTADQARAWELRQRGWTQVRIANELAIDQGTVSRWLSAIEDRELKRLATKVDRAKAFQTAVLEHALDEALSAWETSKNPRTRITKKAGEVIAGPDGQPLVDAKGQPIRGESQQITEVISREGNPAFLDRAFVALTQLRRLWGLDVQAKPNDDSGPLSVAAIAARLARNAEIHESTQIQASQETPSDANRGDQSGDSALL